MQYFMDAKTMKWSARNTASVLVANGMTTLEFDANNGRKYALAAAYGVRLGTHFVLRKTANGGFVRDTTQARAADALPGLDDAAGGLDHAGRREGREPAGAFGRAARSVPVFTRLP